MASGILLAAGAADAARYSARARWRPAGDVSVIGYRVYTRQPGGAFGLALDAGLPVAGADGTLAAVVTNLDACTAYGVVVTGYRAGGGESTLSNEITLDYARVAPLIDSDGDGLSNAAEDTNLDCVVQAGETDPNRADTDGDGVADGRDACRGTAAGAAVNTSGCSCAQVQCDDGNACNGRESCAAGVCRPGTRLDCNDGNACTTDGCSAATGCTHTPVADCSTCTSAAQCDDRNRCTVDLCTRGRCGHAALADGTTCSDGLFCDGMETCQAGVCSAGEPVACDDANTCTTDACDEAERRCTHEPLAECCTADAECAVRDACHTNARCEAGRCLSDPVVCPDAGACGEASCDPEAGCRVTPLPDGTACDDGDACTLGDVCTAGRCGAAELTAFASVGARAPRSVRTSLTMRRSARGLLVNARSSYPGPSPFEVTTGEFHVEVRDGSGVLLLETDVPGSGFEVADGRAVYRDDHRAEGGGFTQVELRARGGRTLLVLRASLPAAGSEKLVLDGLRSGDASSAMISWTLRSSTRCVNGSGQCRGRARRCR